MKEDLQLTEYLIDTVETLLDIVRRQNAKLKELDAVIAEEEIASVDKGYTETMYPDEGRCKE